MPELGEASSNGVEVRLPHFLPIVVLLAIPLYSNAAGTIPIVQALLGKGLPLGTTLAFMMAVTAISLPEFVILRRVMKLPLLAIFIVPVLYTVIQRIAERKPKAISENKPVTELSE